jgi:hypothetical protein
MVLRLGGMTSRGQSLHQVDVGTFVQRHEIDSLSQNVQGIFVVIRKQGRKPGQCFRMPAPKPVAPSAQPVVEHRTAIHSEAFKEISLDKAC